MNKKVVGHNLTYQKKLKFENFQNQEQSPHTDTCNPRQPQATKLSPTALKILQSYENLIELTNVAKQPLIYPKKLIRS